MSEELEDKKEVVIPEKPLGKVWTDEYVTGLREEAKTNRLAKKAAELKLKTLIGLKDDEDVDDTKITAYQAKQQDAITAAMQKANARLISAEIKSLEGYDSKLVERLLDKSKLKIDDDGNVTGLKEAITALEVEFPLIKKSAPAGAAANPPLAGAKTPQDDYDDAMQEALKNPRSDALKRKA